ncbi:hypothetical protein DFH29DRAFT_876908 [Suillus ampliporus]|nr:hypothetical protein DFH29DRAFT_876908 [Suillus ampliporus]
MGIQTITYCLYLLYVSPVRVGVGHPLARGCRVTTSAESSPLDTPELRTKELDSNDTEPDDSEYESKEVQQQLEKDDEKDDEDRESLEGAPDKDSITLPTFSTTSAFLAPFPILQPPFTATSPQLLAPHRPRTPIKPPPNPKVPPQPSPVQRRMTGQIPQSDSTARQTKTHRISFVT